MQNRPPMVFEAMNDKLCVPMRAVVERSEVATRQSNSLRRACGADGMRDGGTRLD